MSGAPGSFGLSAGWHSARSVRSSLCQSQGDLQLISADPCRNKLERESVLSARCVNLKRKGQLLQGLLVLPSLYSLRLLIAPP